MAGNTNIKITLSLDSKQYADAMRQAGQQVQQFAGKLEGDMARASTGADRLANALAKLGHYGAGLFALNKVGELARGFVQTADAVTTLHNTLRLATGSAQAAGQAYTALFDIAQRSRVSFTELGATFASLNRAGQELGVSQARMLVVTESVGNAMAISGGSAESMKAALIQLGQGMASGVLRGEELNSVMEQAPRLAKALADGMGVSIGQLRALGAEGKITAEAVVNALESQAAVLRGEVSGATLTAGQAFTQLSNATTMAVGELDKATGASNSVAKAISGTADAITTAGKAFAEHEGAIKASIGVLAGAGTAAGVLAVSRAITGAGGMVAAITAVRAAFVALSATMAANPVGLALLGVGAAVGAGLGARSARLSTSEGVANEIARTTKDIDRLQAEATLNTTKNDEKRAAAVAARLQELRKNRAALQASYGQMGGDAVSANAEDEKRAAHTAATNAQRQAEEALDKFRQTATGLPESYFTRMKEAIELNKKGLLVGKEWDDYLAKSQKEAQKHLGAVGAGGGKGDSELPAIRAKIAEVERYTKALQEQGIAAHKATEGEKLAGKIQEELKLGLSGAARAQKEKALSAAQALAAAEKLNLAEQARAKAMADSETVYRQELAAMAQSTDAMNAQAAELEAANAAFGKSRTAIEEETMAREKRRLAMLQSLGLEGDTTGELQRQIAARERLTDAMKAAEAKAALHQSAESLIQAQEGNDLVREEVALMGQAKESRARVIAARKAEITLAKELRAIDAQNISSAAKEQLRSEARDKARILAEAEAGRAALDEWTRTTDQINQTLTDALMRGFENGKGFAKNLRDTLSNMFRTLVLRPVISAVMSPVSMGITSMVGSVGNAAAGEAGSGILGSLGASAAGNMLFGGSSLAAVGSSIGTGFMATLSGSSIGAAASAYSAAGMGGVSAGLSIGAALPWVGVALAVASALGLFRKTKKVGAGLTGTLGVEDSVHDVDLMRKSGSLFSGPKYSTKIGGVSAMDDAIQQQFSAGKDAIKTFAQALGLGTDKIAGFTTALGADLIHPDVGIKGILLDGLSEKEAQEKVAAALKSGSNELAQQIIGTWEATTKTVKKLIAEQAPIGGDFDLPGVYREVDDTVTHVTYRPSEFAREGEQAIDTLARLGSSLAATNAMFDALGVKLYAASLAGGDMASKLADLFGGLENMGKATSEYMAGFYSEEERRAAQVRVLQKQMDALGVKMPDVNAGDARAQFRKLAESLDLTTEAGRKTWAGLMQLSGAFAGVTKASESAIEDAFVGLEKAVAAQRKLAEQSAQAAQTLVNEVKGVFDLLQDNVRALYGTVDSTALGAAAQGRDYITKALAAAKATGVLPDRGELQFAISSARDGLQRSGYATQFDRDRETLILAGQLSEMGDISGDQLSTAEKQLKAAKDQLVYLDGVLETARKQIDALNGIDGSVLSVEAAIQRLADALQDKKDKQDQQGGIRGVSQKRLEELQGQFGGSIQSAIGGDQLSKFTMYNNLLNAGLSFNEIRAVVESMAGAQSDQDWANLQGWSGSMSWAENNLAGIEKTDTENKGKFYNNMASTGLSDTQIRDIVEKQLGTQTDADWDALKHIAGVKGYASGGLHEGGLRVVGERGWELEATGPARIWNQEQLSNALNSGGNAELVAEVRALRAEVAALRTAGERTASNTAGLPQMVNQIDNVTEGGNAMRAEVMA